jgi:diaminopimelate decarboxylase
MEVQVMPKERIANFYGKTDPNALIQKYGSPIYVYNEYILKERCKEIKNLLKYPQFTVNYSAKANCNVTLLKLIREAGIHVDAMSPGEIYVALTAGFKENEILYIGNNVSGEEMEAVIEQGIQVSVDSLSQLEMFGKLNPGGQVAVRFNPGIGIGHHAKVITGGEKTKFGIMTQDIPKVKKLAAQYSLRIVGINQHIGSLFLHSDAYLSGVKELLKIASNFKTLDFIDLGGGFGIPYHRENPESRLDLAELGEKLDRVLQEWVTEYGKSITFKVEPGRYLVAECGVLLGSVYATKTNYNTKYIGTDLGFNVLMRPVLYDAYHEIEVYPHDGRHAVTWEEVTIVGNICESGDMIAQNRRLPEIMTGDIIGILDAGAYGYVMSSNYNNRLRPAEVLIKENGEDQLIRRRESLTDLLKDF